MRLAASYKLFLFTYFWSPFPCIFSRNLSKVLPMPNNVAANTRN